MDVRSKVLEAYLVKEFLFILSSHSNQKLERQLDYLWTEKMSREDHRFCKERGFLDLAYTSYIWRGGNGFQWKDFLRNKKYRKRASM